MSQHLGLQVSQGMRRDIEDSCALFCRSQGRHDNAIDHPTHHLHGQATVCPSLASGMRELKTANGTG